MSAEVPVIATYGHGSIKLTAYPSSRRVSVETAGINPVMDWHELIEFVDKMRSEQAEP